MKNSTIFTVFKKEVARFFKDRRTLTALLMPGILIYLIYSLMGNAMNSFTSTDKDHSHRIVAVELPESIKTILDGANVILESTTTDKVDETKNLVANGQCDMIVVFPKNFDADVAAYTPQAGTPAPNVEIYYNSADSKSSNAYTFMTALLNSYESSMTNKFDVNMGSAKYDLATEEETAGKILSMLMPMLLMSLLFSGCMAVAPESIAGEKERGTIATLLVTPIKRSHIAIGKILALSLMALISGASSTAGTLLSLPKMMGDQVKLNGSFYGITDYVLFTLIILSTVLLLITAISVISALAKTVKEASTYVMPLMIISMLLGLTGMLGAAVSNSALYLIPLYNSAQSMIAIFSFNANIVNVLVTVASNAVFTVIGIYALAKMFNSEKIMFNK